MSKCKHYKDEHLVIPFSMPKSFFKEESIINIQTANIFFSAIVKCFGHNNRELNI